MITYLLSTGDEVLLGDIADTNAAWLARQLRQLGIRVQKTVTVGDDETMIATAITGISAESRLCIVTGGLGPTADDITAGACAGAAGTSLVLNSEALKSMTAFFEKRGFELTDENKKQALLPEKAGVLINDHGTAPGFHMKINRCHFFFLPGVPKEMKPMFTGQVVPLLRSRFDLSDTIMIERLTVFGLGESKVGAVLAGAEDKFDGVRFGFRVDFPFIEVKLLSRIQAGDAEQGQILAAAKAWAVAQLKEVVVSVDGLSLAQEVGRLLILHNKTVAVAESCTGGLIANMLTNVSGSSDYFLFSGVTYSNDAKINVLKVKKETIITYGAVHEQTAQEMAQGARKVCGADLAISTTGIAGPTGGTDEKPVGMVCIGFAGSGFARGKTFRFRFDDRMMNKKVFAATALEMLRRHLAALS